MGCEPPIRHLPAQNLAASSWYLREVTARGSTVGRELLPFDSAPRELEGKLQLGGGIRARLL